MNIMGFLTDYGIPHVAEGEKHCTPGWVQIECPFCIGNPGYHLGYNLEGEYWNCWRCGWKHTLQVVKKLLALNNEESKAVILAYSNHHLLPNHKNKEKQKRELVVPGSPYLEKCHIDYLKGRNFNTKKLIETWDIRGTGVIGAYKKRIIAPITHNNQIVSFTGRDITGKQGERYKACSKDMEIVHHKHTLYGIDKAIWNNCIVVEGITDVWRLGEGAVSTFGIEFTNRQVNLLSLKFEKVYVLFDNELTAQDQALKLSYMLSALDIPVYISQIKGSAKDPALLPENLSKDWMNENIRVGKTFI
jgi:hypothetical protein